MNLEKTCLNRFLGKCPGCERDYDTSHYPNNYDCPDYKEIHFGAFYVNEDVKGWEDRNEKPGKD